MPLPKQIKETTLFSSQAISTHYASSHCHYIDVEGTSQDIVLNEVLEVAKRRLGQEADIKYEVRLLSGCYTYLTPSSTRWCGNLKAYALKVKRSTCDILFIFVCKPLYIYHLL